ncbi:hypothetical protein VCHA53O464_220055 [Vibrio chagasii]|nr:hypothetical protein VCHA53O464_220055 [Vibrio chagasii]
MELDVNFKLKNGEIHNVNKNIKSYVSRQEILLAKRLIESKGEVVSRAELLTICWEGKVVTDSSLNVAVRNLRLALIDCKSSLFIITVPRQGYCIKENKDDDDPIDKVIGTEMLSQESGGAGVFFKTLESEENAQRLVFVKYFSQFIFLSMFCFMLYVLIMPYQFENIKGVKVTSYGLSIDDKYNRLFEYLNHSRSSGVYIMPSFDGCASIQIIASINGDLIDLTNKFRLDGCESI